MTNTYYEEPGGLKPSPAKGSQKSNDPEDLDRI